ncbi:MAG: efflux RND transporter periplasmic adaptor subunit, partial [Patescibacteria group bacterium]
MVAKAQNQLKKSKDLAQKTLTSTKKKFTGKRIVIAIVVLLVGFWVIKRSTRSKFDVDVQTVKRQRFVDSVLASGEVAADEAIDLNFETGGTVAEVAVKLGQVVKKGDLIAKLDTTSLYSTYLSAEADLRAKEAALNSVYDDLQGNESTETFAEISTRTTTETNKDKAYRAFVVASRNLSGATLRAPFDGIIASMPEGLATGTNITIASSYQFSVVNPETIYFITEVNELDIPKLTSNLKVKITLDAYTEEE